MKNQSSPSHEQHLISWSCQLPYWLTSQRFSAIKTLLQEIQQRPVNQKVCTTTLGLQGCCARLSLLPLSEPDDLKQSTIRRQLRKLLIELIADTENSSILFDLSAFDLACNATRNAMRSLLITLANQHYQLQQLGYKTAATPKLLIWELHTTPEQTQLAQDLYQETLAIVAGMITARRLADTPSEDCTPESIVTQLKYYSEIHPKTQLTLLNDQQLQQQGLMLLHAVGKGSHRPPYLAVLSYNGAADQQAPYVFVGKGITFDAGGMWLKSGEGMSSMKYDMTGAAVLIGLFDTVCRLALPLNVTIVLALAENMLSSQAMRPGDVVKSYAGLNVEIKNTDAEGRLVLADALSYSEKQLKPHCLIDIATLTGAVVKALGYEISGLMSNDHHLSESLQQAATQSDDDLWLLPCDERFAAQVSSEIADLSNTPPNNAAIAISAGYFLSRFCPASRWAHLDISGTALERRGYTQASGRPLPLLIQFLLNQSANHYRGDAS